MNRAELQRLSDDRVADAAALLAAGRWSAAYYLAGYAVECGLKACIAKQVNAGDFPDKQMALDSYTHNVQLLATVGKADAVIDARTAVDPAFRLNWLAVKQWTEAARYGQWTEAQARRMYAAVADPQVGVLPWLKRYF